MLREVDRGARCESCDWHMVERLRKDGPGLLIPDMQGIREFGKLLAVRARLEMADGHFDKALYTLQTGFALGRHASEGPTLIQDLIGAAIAHMMMARLEELVQRPGGAEPVLGPDQPAATPGQLSQGFPGRTDVVKRCLAPAA